MSIYFQILCPIPHNHQHVKGGHKMDERKKIEGRMENRELEARCKGARKRNGDIDVDRRRYR